jgi:peroxiredoxin
VRFIQIIISFSLLVSTAIAQNGYHFKLKIDGLSDCSKPIVLASYYGDKQFLKDSGYCENGQYHFKGNEKLPTGMYAFILPNQTNADFIVSEFENQTKYQFFFTQNLDIQKSKVDGSLENEVFFNVSKSIQEFHDNGKKAYQRSLDTGITEIEKNNALIEYQNNYVKYNQIIQTAIQDYPNFFVSEILRMHLKPDFSDFQTNPEWSKKEITVKKYYFERETLLSRINFKNSNIVNSKILQELLVEYIKGYMMPYPDSAISFCDDLIARADQANNPNLFRFTLNLLLSQVQKQTYICFDKVTHHLVSKYLLSEKAFWVDNVSKGKMKQTIDRMALNLCGNVAPDLILTDTSFKNNIQLHNIDKKAIVLVFWDVDCSHCQLDMPLINKFYRELNKDDIEIIGVYTKDDFEAWKTFVKKEKLDFINVANVKNTEVLIEKYNVVATPVIFVLDEEKKIVYKNIPAKNLGKALQIVLSNQK